MKNTAVKSLAVAIASVATLGLSSQAAADVYGAGLLEINNLQIELANVAGGGVGQYTFNVGATAGLNAPGVGATDQCTGNGALDPGSTCGGSGAGEVLGVPVVNAAGSEAPLRTDGDFSLFGSPGQQYSNAESSIIDAQLVGDGATATGQVAESNLTSGTEAGASTNVSSNTSLSLEFTLGDNGGLAISFDAVWAAIADINGDSEGSAFGSTSAEFTLRSSNGTFITWIVDGVADNVICVSSGPAAAPTCTESEAGSLNNIANTSENGDKVDLSGSGLFSLAIEGLAAGTYNLGLAAETQTIVAQRFEMPVPGTLLLMGAGLLAGAGVSRRKKA